MRNRSRCLVVLALILTVASTATPGTKDNLIGHWRFDEGSGRKAFDSSANGNTALLSHGVSWLHDGPKGWAVSPSDSGAGYIATPPLPFGNTSSVTIALWTRRTYTTAGGSALFEAGGFSKGNTGFALLPDNEQCKGVQAALRGNEGTTANCYAQPSSGVWHLVAVVYDKRQTGGDGIAFYVDGVLQHPTWSLSSVTNTGDFSDSPLYLFGTEENSHAGSGSISDLRIYKGALTAAQIQAIYNTRPKSSPSGLVAAYAFNEGIGSTVTDLSGNGNTGILSNVLWTSAGKYGKALVFNGNSSLVTVSDSLSLHLGSAMTLEAWINPMHKSTYWADVISKGNHDYSLGGISHYANGPPTGAMLGGSSAGTLGSSDLPLNVWTHLATTFDGSTLRFYVNGELVSTEPYSGTIPNSRTPLHIGGNSIVGQFFTGIIDELRIYQTALTQAQIQSDMDMPISPSLISISVTPRERTVMEATAI
jgi:concanavalin A-like lectin/glucanase superfamily protein